MRIVTYGAAISLDGFLADANGSIDWLHFSKDVQEVMTSYWKDVDTILMGRKTYAVSTAQNSAATEKTKTKEPAMRTCVFSRSLTSIDAPGIELVSGDAVEFVRDLKQHRKHHLPDGWRRTRSISPRREPGRSDRLQHPPHSPRLRNPRDPGHRVRLILAECRQIDGGCILANYNVIHTPE